MIDAWVNECVRNTEYADKYGMTYEVSEVALAAPSPSTTSWTTTPTRAPASCPPSTAFGMLSFRELDAQREKLGVQVLFDCHDERLIQNPETKEIVGAYTMIGSEEKTVKARKGVIMTTGGFEFNEDLKNAYLKCYPFKFEGWQFNTGDGIKMVEEVGGKLWHMGMAGAMYGMWTRDPDYDFAIFASPQSDAFFTVNRLGKRYQNEAKTGGTAHNGWHTLMSFSDKIDDYDRIPSWQIFDQKGIDGGPMGTQQGGWFECGNYTTDLPDEIRAWNGWSQDNKAELDKGWILKGDTIEELGKKIKEFDHWMDVDALKATFDEYRHSARQRRTRVSTAPRRRSRSWTTARTTPSPSPRLLLHLGRPDEERARPGCWIPPRTPSASVRGGLLRQLPEPQLRHHRRQQRREPGVGPHFRPSRRGSRALGRQVASSLR